MTLKLCKVTQLDDTFWRVDWEGAATVDQGTRRITHSSPRIAEHRDGEWFFCGYWSESLADALALWGLTTEQPKPEIAEERVRAWVDDACEGRETDWLRPTDLRAILAELATLRERIAALEAELEKAKDRSDAYERGRAAVASALRRLVNRIDFLASTECNADMRDEAMGWCRDLAARLERKGEP